MVGTDDLAHCAADLLQADLEGFRYYKSYRQFRRRNDDTTDDVIVEVTACPGGGPPYSLAFIFGVQHHAVEKIVAEVNSEKVTPFCRTVFQSSYNISPSREMSFNGPTVWFRIKSAADLTAIQRSLQEFLHGVVVPYHRRFRDMLIAREHLGREDGWVLNHTPYEQVLVIDAIHEAGERAGSYLLELQRRADSGFHYDKDRFNAFYARLRQR